MKTKIYIILLSFLLSSCGVFLQNSGIKNYSPKQRISKNGLNDYQYDFLYLNELVEEAFPQLDKIFPEVERKIQVQTIVSRLATVDNNTDFVLLMRKYLSNLKNQHTSIGLQHKFNSIYPFVIYINSDDWYLLNLSKQYDSLAIGKKIVKINEISCAEIENKLINFTFAENKINQQFAIRNLQLYNKPEYLKEIGVISSKLEPLKLEFEDSSTLEIALFSVENNAKVENYNILFKSNEITSFKNETYFYKIYKEQNFGYLQFNNCHDKIDILDGIKDYVKPWLHGFANAYVKLQFKKEKPSQRILKYYNPKYPHFKDFVKELVDSLNNEKVENLVIDLRNNPGGNLTLGVQLMYFLTDNDSLLNFQEFAYTSAIYKKYFNKEYTLLEKKYNQKLPQKKLIELSNGKYLFDEIRNEKSPYYIPVDRPIFKGKIYILSNFRTGSAAALLTTLFQDNEIGTIIGTSVGNNPIGATTFTPMTLPKTKAKISIATRYLERPKKNKGKVQIPDFWVENTLNDLIIGHDSYLEKAKNNFGIYK